MSRKYHASPDLDVARTARQECFGDAFLLAVASVAGCAISRPRPDDDSIDWTLSCKLNRRPKLDVQIKTTSRDVGKGEIISFPLKKKNYDDLILQDILTPRILVLVILPENLDDWLSLTEAELVLRRCGYWVSLAGRPQSENDASVTVDIPRRNLLTPEAIREMMSTINEQGSL